MQGLRACLNFLQLLLSFFSVCFPLFLRHIARYAPHKNRKTSSKRTLKIMLKKI